MISSDFGDFEWFRVISSDFEWFRVISKDFDFFDFSISISIFNDFVRFHAISNDFLWFRVISCDFLWFLVISSDFGDFSWFLVISSDFNDFEWFLLDFLRMCTRFQKWFTPRVHFCSILSYESFSYIYYISLWFDSSLYLSSFNTHTVPTTSDSWILYSSWIRLPQHSWSLKGPHTLIYFLKQTD